MKKSNSKFFIIIGVLLIIASLLIYSDDFLISIIGMIFGVSNLTKGIRLSMGIEPLLIRKQNQRYKKDRIKLKNKKKNKENPRNI